LQIKTGIGYDIHRLGPGRKLYLGGWEIPYSKGLLGHSDGDCLIHAIIDALLGALGEKDIGQCFQDTNPAYKNIRSTEMLVSIAVRLKEMDFEIANVDSIPGNQSQNQRRDRRYRAGKCYCSLGHSPADYGIRPLKLLK
jgi:2-C-methyl-D-erythritol 2,4-cyclodiphosphate synthase